jgi:hypothetical protein
MKKRRNKHKHPARTLAAQPAVRYDAAPVIAPPQQSTPLLSKWPASHRYGAYKIDGDDIALFAQGRPDLRLRNAF